MDIVKHMDVPNSPTGCPGRLFDVEKIEERAEVVYSPEGKILPEKRNDM